MFRRALREIVTFAHLHYVTSQQGKEESTTVWLHNDHILSL